MKLQLILTKLTASNEAAVYPDETTDNTSETTIDPDATTDNTGEDLTEQAPHTHMTTMALDELNSLFESLASTYTELSDATGILSQLTTTNKTGQVNSKPYQNLPMPSSMLTPPSMVKTLNCKIWMPF